MRVTNFTVYIQMIYCVIYDMIFLPIILRHFHVEIVPMKVILLYVLLCLFWSLVEVQSQTEYPYISLLGNHLPNHSYVDLSQVGTWNNTLQCHTDLSTCCRRQPNGIPGRGDWFAPGSDTRLPFYSSRDSIQEDRQHQVVHLRHRYYYYAVNETSRSGIYRCVIPTNAVHNDSDASVGETVYVGLYTSGGGMCILNNTYICLYHIGFLFVIPHLHSCSRVSYVYMHSQDGDVVCYRKCHNVK